MIERDFHGYLLDDALREVELIIGDIRKRGVTEEVKFITGHGKIQIGILELFNDYHIGANIQLSNSGVIVATID
jgi:hypothetical protein